MNSSPNIIKVNKARKIKGTGHVACVGEVRNMSQKQNGIDHLGSVGVGV
jgi:hypothetical protein